MSEPLALVMIPGLACTRALFAAQREALAAHRPVVVARVDGGDSMAAMAGAILASAPPRFHLAGLSMGGYIALEILRQAPERVARLCLMDSSARPDTPDKTALRQAALAEVEAGRYMQMSAENVALSVAASRADDHALRAAILDMARATGAGLWRRQMRAIMGRPDSRPDLPAIRARTLVLVGDEDRLTPPEHAREMAAAIPDARLEVIADCGHMSSMERPGAVSRLLADWLT